MPPRRPILLIPGLFSPRWLMWSLSRALDAAGFAAEIWDHGVLRDIDATLARLERQLARCVPGLGVVTHSFGDWLFRQVAIGGGAGAATSLVAIAPVMSASPAARILRTLSGLLPAIEIMASRTYAASALETGPAIDRLVVWAAVDIWVRPVPLEGSTRTRTVTVPGLHNSLLWQPAVHRLAADHFLQQPVPEQ